MLGIHEGDRGYRVRHHNDDPRFNPASEDTFILRTLYDEDPAWVFVGGDGKILRNRAELAVLAEVNLTYLLFDHPWCNKKIKETCWMLIRAGRRSLRTSRG